MFNQILNQYENNKLGSLQITDVRQGDHVAEMRHVMDWLKRNRDLFKSIPSEPRLLQMSNSEQTEMVEKYSERTCRSNDEPDEVVDDASFVFAVESDFRKFMEYVNKFNWDIGVRGPMQNTWEGDDDPIQEKRPKLD